MRAGCGAIAILASLVIAMWLLGCLFPAPGDRVEYRVHGFEGFEDGPPTRCVYYAMSGCPHCVRFDPVWNEVASAVSGVEMKRYDVSTPEGRAEAEKADVRAFPRVMKFYSDGSSKTFEGERTAAALKYFCAH